MFSDFPEIALGDGPKISQIRVSRPGNHVENSTIWNDDSYEINSIMLCSNKAIKPSYCSNVLNIIQKSKLNC